MTPPEGDEVIVRPPDRRPTGHRTVPLLSEPDLQHYPEFATFLSHTFGLADDPLGPPGLVEVSGRLYELVFIGRSGRPFPAGVEISALVRGLEPLDEPQADLDLWAVLHWLVGGVGGEWSVEGLTTTGRIYRVPGA